MTARPVLVAVPTYKRTALLPALVAAIRQDAQTTALQTRIVLFDNDPAASAAQVAAEMGVGYVAVPTPGIAAVRQTALDHAADAELLVMIDDDVLPEPGCLNGLVSVWESTRATAVMGYVRYVWPTGTDPWVQAGAFMRRSRIATGTPLSDIAMGNVLVDVAAVRRLGVGFDLSLGLFGGEDTRFGQSILKAGGSIVAAANSVCRDDIPTARTSRSWLRKRTVSHGELLVRLSIGESHGMWRVLRSGAHLAGGAVRWVTFSGLHQWGRIARDLQRDAVGQRRAWFAVGRMRGAVGAHAAEYAREAASPVRFSPGEVLRRGAFEVKTRLGARASREASDRLERDETLDPAALAHLSARRAVAQARFAMMNSPFYRDLYSAHGFSVDDLLDPAAFSELPIVEKMDVRENFERFRTEECSSRNSAVSLSGGSTGEPIRILRDLRAPTRAIEWRLFRWWDVSPWDHRADVYRHMLTGTARMKHALQWWPSKRLHLNAREMSEAQVRAFVSEWNHTRPRLLLGYVGGVLELCRATTRLGLTMTAPAAVALTAAPLPVGVRGEIEETLGAPAFDHYRSSEVPWMAGECREHAGLHVFSDVRHLEILDGTGGVSAAGVMGEVVATDLTNRVFPLIRYRLGDRTSWLEGSCACGVQLPRIAPVAGRVSDVLRLPDGGAIAGESLTGLFNDAPTAVRQFQLLQAADHSITLRCIRGTSASAEAEIRSATEYLRRLARGLVQVRYEMVDDIRHENGKPRYIISQAVAAKPSGGSRDDIGQKESR